MSKHTPGTWVVDSDKTGHPQFITVAELDLSICSMFEWDDPAWVHANARLIAAAPDLLAALKDLVANGGSKKGRELVVARLDGLANARAAIAKAEATHGE